MEGDMALRHMLLERGLEDWELIEGDHCDKEKDAEAKSSTQFSSVLRHFFIPIRHSPPLVEQEQTTTIETEGGAER